MIWVGVKFFLFNNGHVSKIKRNRRYVWKHQLQNKLLHLN